MFPRKIMIIFHVLELKVKLINSDKYAHKSRAPSGHVERLSLMPWTNIHLVRSHYAPNGNTVVPGPLNLPPALRSVINYLPPTPRASTLGVSGFSKTPPIYLADDI